MQIPKSIVVLMLENRSFDSMLGYLPHPHPDFEGISGTESNPDCAGAEHAVGDGGSRISPVDPDHTHLGVMNQLMGPDEWKPGDPYTLSNRGFIVVHEKKSDSHAEGLKIMQCLKSREQASVLAELALGFAVCDHWFCSVPGQTLPNRDFAASGTSRGAVDNRYGLRFRKTAFHYAERRRFLRPRKRDWAVFHDGLAHLMIYPSLWGSRFQSMADFYERVEADRLPKYSFIEPRHSLSFLQSENTNCQHPGGNKTSDRNFRAAENLIAEIYGVLRANPDVFNKTLLVITYDEHGGFFDHCPAGDSLAPDGSSGQHGFGFDLTGPRVPAVLVSPWIPQATLDQTPYDHSSIVASVRRAFAPSEAPLGARDAAAGHFLSNLSLPAPRVRDLPDPAPTPLEPDETAALTTEPAELGDFEQAMLDLAVRLNRAADGESVQSLAEGAEPVHALRAEPHDPATVAAMLERAVAFAKGANPVD
jgi:phospholipase C